RKRWSLLKLSQARVPCYRNAPGDRPTEGSVRGQIHAAPTGNRSVTRNTGLAKMEVCTDAPTQGEFMKHPLALIGGILFVAGTTLAQAPSQSAPPQHQPGVPAQSAQPSELKPLPAAGAPAATAEKVDPEKEKAIRHLMEITGSSGENMTANMASQVKSVMSRSMSGDRLQKFVDDF